MSHWGLELTRVTGCVHLFDFVCSILFVQFCLFDFVCSILFVRFRSFAHSISFVMPRRQCAIAAFFTQCPL